MATLVLTGCRRALAATARRVHACLTRTRRRIGYRGAILAVLGASWIITGLSTFESSIIRAAEPLIHEQLPPAIRGWAWVITGAIALTCTLTKATGHKPAWEGVAFLALYLMPTLRLVSYTTGWADSWPWLHLLGGVGYADGWRFAGVYLAQVGMVIICSSWPEPARLTEQGKADE